MSVLREIVIISGYLKVLKTRNTLYTSINTLIVAYKQLTNKNNKSLHNP